MIASPQLPVIKREESWRQRQGERKDIDALQRQSTFLPFQFFSDFFQIVTYASHVFPLIQLQMHQCIYFPQQRQRCQPTRPTFITLIHNMTLLRHLSSQRFSGPEALVSEATDGGWVCVYGRLYVYMCAWALVCVRAGRAAQDVFELMADRSKFAHPYVWIRSYIHHLSQYDANLALLSLWTFSVFPTASKRLFWFCRLLLYTLQLAGASFWLV